MKICCASWGNDAKERRECAAKGGGARNCSLGAAETRSLNMIGTLMVQQNLISYPTDHEYARSAPVTCDYHHEMVSEILIVHIPSGHFRALRSSLRAALLELPHGGTPKHPSLV